MEGICIRYLCWVVCWNIVQSLESPTLRPLATIDNCTNCIVGEHDVRLIVFCDVLGGAEPDNVTMEAGYTPLSTVMLNRTTEKYEYKAFVYLNDAKHHKAKMTCSVLYNATNETFTAEAEIYVTVVSDTEPSLHIQSRLKEGDPVKISCHKGNVRPAATNITMLIDGKIVDGLELEHYLHPNTLRYSSWMTLTKLQRDWNKKNVTCCEYNKDFLNEDSRMCSPPKTVDFIFPPSNVTLLVANYSEDAKQFYIMTATCHISHSNPACNVTWQSTTGTIISHGLNESINNSEDGSFTTIFSATINFSRIHVGKQISCTPSCTHFVDVPTRSWSIKSNEPESGNSDTRTTVKQLPFGMVAGIGGAVAGIIVMFVSVFVVLKCKKTKDSDEKASDNNDRQDGEEMQELQQILESPHNNEEDNAVQLVYADVEFDPNAVSSHISRRESQVDYAAIDLVKTADIAGQDHDESEEKNIYYNQ